MTEGDDALKEKNGSGGSCNMWTLNKVKIEVIEVRGRGCDYGMEVGDVFYIDENHCNICMWAATSIFPLVQVLKYGGHFRGTDEPYTCIACCPDAVNTVVFKMSLDGEQDWPSPIIKLKNKNDKEPE